MSDRLTTKKSYGSMNLDPDNYKAKLILLCAQQGYGKTHTINYILYQLRKVFDYGIVFTNTKFDNPFPCFPEKYVFDYYSEEALENLMKIQGKMVLKEKAKPLSKRKYKEAVVIFDDCLDDPGEFCSEALKKLSTQLRHYHITLILSTQYCNLLPPRIRTNAMIVMIYQSDTKANLESMYDSFGQRFDSYKEFKNYVIDNLEEKYRFIYYDKLTEEKEIDKVYQVMICPPKIPKFKLKF